MLEDILFLFEINERYCYLRYISNFFLEYSYIRKYRTFLLLRLLTNFLVNVWSLYRNSYVFIILRTVLRDVGIFLT